MSYMSPSEITARKPESLGDSEPDSLRRLRRRIQGAGQWHGRQVAGSQWSIACVSLEVTQRCNLDCTLCYLSEASEAVKDVPLEELFRRIDEIHAHYGDQTNIQVSGGDPTLRDRAELVEVVRYIKKRNMRSALFTNGILAKRDLLIELRDAGLNDVAFHVDLTQKRKGYASEVALNLVRLEYLERARGLGLAVFFNTTVFDGNFQEIPELSRFFANHADQINMASFQLQADTGRGVLRERGFMISQETVAAQIQTGVGRELDFGSIEAGHGHCNRFALGLVCGARVHDALDNRQWIEDLLSVTRKFRRPVDRSRGRREVWKVVGQLLSQPIFVLKSLPYLARKFWSLLPDVLRSRGRVHSIQFFIHNFMGSEQLECERIDSCVFMVATSEGPMSMCLHNAQRDAFLLKPLRMEKESVVKFWNPITGKLQDDKPGDITVQHTRKTARGRARQAMETA